jgi:membrane-associated protein
VAAVAAGSVVGETVGYGIGRTFGGRVQASRVGRWLGPQRWARAAEFLRRRGARAVFAGRFLAAVHAVLPIVAGTVRMGYQRFLAAAVLGALTWSALYLAIGALAGASYRAVAERLNEVSGILAGALIGAALFAGVVMVRQGIVRLSNARVDAGVTLAVAALVGVGITIAQEPGARPPDALAYMLGVTGAAALLVRPPPAGRGPGRNSAGLVGLSPGRVPRRSDQPAGAGGRLHRRGGRPVDVGIAGRGAFTGAGFAHRSLVGGDPLVVEAFSAAALLPTLALLGDAAYRRRFTASQAGAVVDWRGTART